MKLTDNRRKRPTIFRDLRTGDAFEYEGMIWLKITFEEAFNLEDEEIDGFCDDTIIHPVKLNITVED